MNPTIQPLCFEDRDFAVLTYRVVRGTPDGTIWRFITKHETVVVVPCQTAAAPAGEPPCVPSLVFPVLCGPGKSTLASLVRRVVRLETYPVGSSDRDAEVEKEVRACLARYGIEKLTKPKLRAIIESTWNLFPALGRPVMSLEIGGREMRQVLAKIQEVSGRDITSAVKLDCTPNFAESATAWAARAAKLEGTSERVALRLLLGKVKYVGVPAGGIAIPLESVIPDVPDAEDTAALNRVLPVSAQVRNPPDQGSSAGTGSAGTNEQSFKLGEYCSQQEIISDVLGGSRKIWEVNRAEVGRDTSPFTPPRGKRVLYHKARVTAWFVSRNKIRS